MSEKLTYFHKMALIKKIPALEYVFNDRDVNSNTNIITKFTFDVIDSKYLNLKPFNTIVNRMPRGQYNERCEVWFIFKDKTYMKDAVKQVLTRQYSYRNLGSFPEILKPGETVLEGIKRHQFPCEDLEYILDMLFYPIGHNSERHKITIVIRKNIKNINLTELIESELSNSNNVIDRMMNNLNI